MMILNQLTSFTLYNTIHQLVHLLPSNIIWKKVAGKAFVIGNGQFNIDWVSVEDVAAAHVLAEMALNGTPKTFRGQVYNVCINIDD